MTFPSAPASPDGAPSTGSWRQDLLARQPWLVFLLPFVLFLLGTACEPKPPVPADDGKPAEPSWTEQLGIEYRHYPLVYTVKIALVIAAIWFVAPGYRQFPFSVSPLAALVGLVGGVLWIVLCRMELEQRFLPAIGLGWLVDQGQRSAFNPLVELADTPAWAYGFLAIRFVGLAVVVPIIEELFLRGWLMRFVVDAQWWKVPFGTANATALVVGTVVPMLMHPGELLAAAAWFSLISWLMVRTRNIWDCVAAHGLTNLALGVYVVATGHWELM